MKLNVSENERYPDCNMPKRYAVEFTLEQFKTLFQYREHLRNGNHLTHADALELLNYLVNYSQDRLCTGCNRVVTQAHACPGPGNEKDVQNISVSVVLTKPIDLKVKFTVIKILRRVLSGPSFAEYKDLIDTVPATLFTGNRMTAEDLLQEFREVGATVELRVDN